MRKSIILALGIVGDLLGFAGFVLAVALIGSMVMP
jgi:hypothetical protein